MAIANLLVASALWQVWLFGAIVLAIWLARHRSRLSVVMVAFALATVVSLVLTSLLQESPIMEFSPMALPVAVAAIFGLLGVLLTWHAYRRWLVTDLD